MGKHLHYELSCPWRKITFLLEISWSPRMPFITPIILQTIVESNLIYSNLIFEARQTRPSFPINETMTGF